MNQNIQSFFKILGAIITISLGAQLTINIGAIPITGQTLFILIWAFFLNPKESCIAILLYLIFGFIGLPIFANGSSGISKLTGGSGGFLVGFFVAALLVSYFKSSMNFTYLSILLLTSIGTLIIVAFGTIRLISIYGFETGLEYGFYPFWKGALIKVVMGSIVVWGISKLQIRLKSQAT